MIVRAVLLAALLGAGLLGGGAPRPPDVWAAQGGIPGKPGPRVPGAPVDPHKLSSFPEGETPEREVPRHVQTSQAEYGQLKAEANRQAAAERRGGPPQEQSGPPPTFASLDMSGGGGWNPPDGGLAVGPATVLVAVNEAFAMYTRTGTTSFGPKRFVDLFASVGIHATDSVYDPKALYDRGWGRFVLLATTGGAYTLAVSSDSSGLSGAWCTYAIQADPTGATWADFPGLSTDGDNLYITSNQFSFSGNSFQYAQLVAIPKASVYPSSGGVCGPATPTMWSPLKNPDGGLSFTVQPADQPDAAAGTDGTYLVNAIWSSGSNLVVRSVSQTSSGLELSAPAWIGGGGGFIGAYSLPADTPQPGGSAIDTGDTRLLGATYRYGKIYTANTTRTVNKALSSNSNAYANVQWYEITPSTASPTSGTTYTGNTRAITNPTVAYFFPGILPGCTVATTGACSTPYVGLQFSGAGSRQTASAFTARASATSISTPANYAGGVRGYTKGSRWGDYPGIAADPGDATKVWVLGEYAKTTSGWGTAVTTVP